MFNSLILHKLLNSCCHFTTKRYSSTSKQLEIWIFTAKEFNSLNEIFFLIWQQSLEILKSFTLLLLKHSFNLKNLCGRTIFLHKLKFSFQLQINSSQIYPDFILHVLKDINIFYSSVCYSVVCTCKYIALDSALGVQCTIVRLIWFVSIIYEYKISLIITGKC